MENINPDANTAVDSSTTTTQGATDTSASPSTQDPQAALDAGLASIVDKAMEQNSDSSPESKSVTEEKVSPPSNEEKETEVEKKEEQTESNAEEQKIEDGNATGPVPVERFKKVYSSWKETERQFEAAKPLIESHQQILSYLNEHGVSNEDFNLALSFIAAAATNPQEALKLIEPKLSQLKSVTGEELPDDLRKAVEAGEMTEAWAKKLAATQGQKRVTEQEFKRRQEALLQQRTQEYQAQNMNAVNTWVTSKQKLNPDFKPTSDPKNKGVYELTTAFAKSAVEERTAKGKIPTPEELVVILDEAYSDAQNMLQRYTKSAPTSKQPSSTRASSGGTKPPSNFNELQAAVLAKHSS